jgi:hypothetical protein
MIERRMLRTTHGLRSGLLALIVGLAVSAPCQAQQFSAELKRTQDGITAPAGQLRVSGDKERIESPDLADGFFLIDSAKPTAYFVRPGSGVFMDAKQSNPLVRLFVPVDPDNPCRQWQAMAEIAGLKDQGDLKCEPAEPDRIGGHDTIAYRAAPANGNSFIGWIDRTRRFPLRIKTQDGAVITAEAIRDEPQDAALFEMPPHAHKFEPQALINQMKQSDVWVTPPKPAP